MNKRKLTSILSIYGLVVAVIIACGQPQTITETMTEAEFNEEGFEYYEGQFIADFQPGKIVLTGEVEEHETVIEIGLEIVEGKAAYKLLSVTVGGQELPQDLLAQVDADVSEVFYTPDEGYVVTEVSITDDEMTITSARQ